ncbi:hypothetical protein EKO04_005391 [Ascochyta lentis]|uniref:Uncharacterized protein n=1 Tax=Ascochyta lentis TaxID=205686 RepID=A0A8H7MK18_9PLEO|nr:hypothetical protein EKO04_005391 [Ascochyta lentis]
MLSAPRQLSASTAPMQIVPAKRPSDTDMSFPPCKMTALKQSQGISTEETAAGRAQTNPQVKDNSVFKHPRNSTSVHQPAYSNDATKPGPPTHCSEANPISSPGPQCSKPAVHPIAVATTSHRKPTYG